MPLFQQRLSGLEVAGTPFWGFSAAPLAIWVLKFPTQHPAPSTQHPAPSTHEQGSILLAEHLHLSLPGPGPGPCPGHRTVLYCVIWVPVLGRTLCRFANDQLPPPNERPETSHHVLTPDTMSATTMVAADDSPSDATRSVHTRNTKGGRRLHYELTCLQQPERARACGSGQKSAADRRPVDPPPVVQLRVLEGPTLEDSKDITLGYNANFFVYVDLQHARPIANGRVQTPAATTPPVLTGAPVSGMAYLDRPAEAGYFLFPDLAQGRDGSGRDPVDDDPTPGFYLRMKVQSAPFVVFSAKKFPGLTSSTTLSRTISEQGCRVRIRRDVRMRRRDGKPSGGDYEKEEEAARSRRTQTPDIRKDQMRGRSVSDSSEQRAPYSAVSERRPSEMDAYPAPPPPPAPIAVPNAHSRYGSDASSNGYAPHHIQTASQPPPVSPTSGYHSGQPSPYATAPPAGFGYQSRPAPHAYSSSGTTPTTPRDAYDRRPSAFVPPSPSHAQFASHEMDYRRDSVYKQELPRAAESRRDSLTHIATKRDTPRTPIPETFTLPPILSGRIPGPSGLGSLVKSALMSDVIEPASPVPQVVAPLAHAGSKRGYADTFVENQQSALRDGQRPPDNHQQPGSADHDPHEDPDKMYYKRASGIMAFKYTPIFTK
ncbi:Developmental and secondary metabolism regulator VEL1 like protein [Verticillium longisporum]|uniref:Developmental and secondary metabolism regulator VEL1 like protein n=1 Tax=Verticillium longisporum TaxID=100787 RepID=A0A8I2ZVV8_VERLO|nr:Developmental and secondary metabolism regulator VEL1 like protein [Verticillium longisporum]